MPTTTMGALPSALQAIAAVNPLTYGIDLMKHALLGSDPGGRFGAELPVGTDVAVLAATFAVALALTVALFNREARLTRTVTAGERQQA